VIYLIYRNYIHYYFDEFVFLKDRTFDEYFGLTEDEIIELCNKNISFKVCIIFL
jgi:hypothetical protein